MEADGIADRPFALSSRADRSCKGIAYKQNSDSAQVLQGVDYELVLLDANRKELATRKGRTNDFGSFATEFVLPAACLNGMFSIRTKEPQSTVTLG